MSFRLYPGIRFDPREPPPPGLASRALGKFSAFKAQYEVQNDTTQPPKPSTSESPASDLSEFLSPYSTSVKVGLVHDTAKFTVTQIFINTSIEMTHGVYQFPLPLDATVTSLTCYIGNKVTVRGVVKAREDALHEFEAARRQGRAGALVERYAAEVFKMSLANIPTNTKTRVELSFICLLKHRATFDREILTLVLPTYIAPRYGTPPPGIRWQPPGNHALRIEVDVLAAEEILSIKSDTHSIQYTRGSGQQSWDDFINHRDNAGADLRKAWVNLDEGVTSLDKDLVIEIETLVATHGQEPQACLETHPTLENHQAMMLTIPPEFMMPAEIAASSGEIIFLADRSGSMDDKMENLKSAMMFFVKGIPANRPFNIWCFGSTFESLWPQSQCLSESTMQEAIAYVRQVFESNMGGTEILPALQAICEARAGLGSMDIVVLTDGEVWAPTETIDFVKEKWVMSEGMIRFFSLGIGDCVSRELVEGIAKAGGGYAEIISSASDSNGWEDRVVAVLKAATTGHVGPLWVDLEWETYDEAEASGEVSYRQSPDDISSMSLFSRSRMFLLFDSGDQHPKLNAIVLTARRVDGFDITKRIQPKQLSLPDDSIHKLAAGALLDDLERKERNLRRPQLLPSELEASRQAVRDEATSLGCKWSLVSKWTSLFAVEELARSEEANDDIETVGGSSSHADPLLASRGSANLSLIMLGPVYDNKRSDNDSDSDSDSSITRWITEHEEEHGKAITAWKRDRDLRIAAMEGYRSISSIGDDHVHQEAKFRADVARLVTRHGSGSSSQPKSPPACTRGITKVGRGRGRNLCKMGPSPRPTCFDENDENDEPGTRFGMRTRARATEEAAQRFIRELLVFQSFNGKFVFQNEDVLKNTLGLSFLKVVKELDSTVHDFDSSATIGIVALLEEQFQTCQDLWVLMVRKAKNYISTCALSSPWYEILLEARISVASMKSVLEELKDSEATSSSVIELESAPTA